MAIGLGLGNWVSRAEAEPMYAGPYEPMGIRIPAAIELLKNTPYYSDPKLLDENPEGVFAPQTVRVLRTQAAWSTGTVIWEIETMFGPRWIHPNAWDIDIAPPERITLLEETPLFRTQSERGGPVASLSPQEVQVVGAQKQWFYTNDPSSKAWIQIHTTWMGDLWAHIPVNRIGTHEKVERKAHFNWLFTGVELGSAMGIPATNDVEQAQQESIVGVFNIVGKFTTIYDSAFQVQVENETTWSRESGIELLDTNERLELKSEKPIISDIWESPFKEIGMQQAGKVTVFEKVTESLWGGGRYIGIRPLWFGSTWYHVRTPEGTGWINKLYGEPESAVPVRWLVDLSEQKELQRYPSVPFASSIVLPQNQRVEATAAWDDPSGQKWLKVNIDGRTGWIPFYSGALDRLWNENGGTALQIRGNGSNGLTIETSETGELQLLDGQRIGLKEDGKDYLDAIQLAEQLQFKVEKVSYADAVSFSQGEYSFILENGHKVALIYWQGELQRSYAMKEHPRVIGDSWNLELDDVKELFGLSRSGSNPTYYLHEDDYSIALGTLPTKVTNGRLELQAFLYDWQSSQEQTEWMPLKLTLEMNSDRGGEDSVSQTEAIISNTAQGENAFISLFNVSASRSLNSGSHQVDMVLRVGERIVWKQTMNVVVE
jgi:hypothetical protein